MAHRLGRLLVFGLGSIVLCACDARTAQEHLDRAAKYRGEGEVNSALIEYKNAIQKDPNLGEARLSLGEYYLELEDIESSVKELERALDLGMARDRVVPPLLEAKADLGKKQEVLGALEGVDMTPRLQAVHGQVLLAAGDLDGARTDFEAAMAGDPGLPRPYLGLAAIMRSGPVPDLEGAAEMLRKGSEVAPDNRRIWLTLGEVELNRMQTAAAAEAFEKVGAMPGRPLMADLGLARVRLLEQKPDEARRLVDDVIGRAPKHPLAHHLRGVIALEQGDLKAAESEFESTLSIIPDYPPAQLALAHVKFAQGQPKQAESYLRQYLAKVPDDISARKSLAGLLLQAGDARGAVDALAPVRERLTSGPDLALLGTAYLRAGQLREASRYIAAAGEAKTDVPVLNAELAVSLAAAGDNAAAMAQLDAIVPTDGVFSQSEALRVALMVRSGDLDGALAAANQMIERKLELPLAYNVLGTVQVARGDRAAARAAFGQSLAADAGFGTATMNLARLDVLDGKTDDARRRLERALEADPADVELLVGLADLELAAGAAARGAELLERARSADSTALVPRLALARLALQAGDLSRAESLSAEAEAINAGTPDVLLLRAQVSASRGQTAALARYLDSIETFMQSAPADIVARLRVPVGELQARAGRTAQARTNLQAALESERASVTALLALTQLEIAADALESARGYVKRLTAAGAPAATVRELEGDIAVRANDLDGAAARFEDAAAAGSRSAVTKLANVRVRQGNADVAMATLDRWLATHPDDDAARMQLASVRLAAGDQAGARRDYEALLERHDDDAALLNNLAWLYFEAKDPRAEPMARRAVAAAPDNPDIADTLGWILAQSDAPGAAAEAVDVLVKAAAARRSNATVWYHLAVAQQKAGRTREAAASVERALGLGEFAERSAAEELAKALGGA